MCETAFTRHAGKDFPEFLPLARSSLTLSAGREKSAFTVCFQWSSGFRASNCSIPNCNSPGSWPGNSYFRIPNMLLSLAELCPAGWHASPAGALPSPLATGPPVFHPPPTHMVSGMCLSLSSTASFSLSQPVLFTYLFISWIENQQKPDPSLSFLLSI